MDFDPRDYDDARDRDDGIYDSRWGEDPRDAETRELTADARNHDPRDTFVIGGPNNRHRKSASKGRFVERMMLLDAVLADTDYTWLGTEQDKLAYFMLYEIKDRLDTNEYPHITLRRDVSSHVISQSL